MMWMSCAWSQGPKIPWAPNSSTRIMPEITGETASGRSIRVIRMFLPRKSNLVIAQDAAIPNVVLSGTAMDAVNNVNSMAQRASDSAIAER